MANYSCPSCETNLRKRNSTTGLVPWWKPLPAEAAYKASLVRCMHCHTLLEKKLWPKGIVIRASTFFAGAAFGGAAFYYGFDMLPYPFWISLGVGLGLLAEALENLYSARPAFIASDLTEEAIAAQT